MGTRTWRSLKASVLSLAIVLGISGCDPSKPDKDNQGGQSEHSASVDELASKLATHANRQARTNELLTFSDGSHLDTGDYQLIEWADLIPQDDLAALLNPPAYLTSIEDGSPEDQIASTIQSAMAANQAANQLEAQADMPQVDPYEQALISTNIIEAMNGKGVRIPGFVVPLEYNEQQVITSFFFVPFFGACIHLPPPPPNQIIFVEAERGFTLENLYEPIWISGTLATELFEDQLATAAYTMTLAYIERYDG
ncbi:DUF3299 domain-containing protein [Thalassotalea euphylliae]|uniref:DUF3299 domain-containing protein n=2 Tax=Thalassotalea euphylliae TaxID=1655234 RepID=A0A3E0TTQ7_9GAMM|nr:DUF3299 domain-containing protein [Thalassotalea euphylliae]